MGMKSEYSRAAVSRLENGKRGLSFETMVRVARVLGYELNITFTPISQTPISAVPAARVAPGKIAVPNKEATDTPPIAEQNSKPTIVEQKKDVQEPVVPQVSYPEPKVTKPIKKEEFENVPENN